jgi:hypothetical protein
MSIIKKSRLARGLATGLLSVAGVVATAIPASALDDPNDPPPPSDDPPAGAYQDLVASSAKVTPYGSTEWQVDVTVNNLGNNGSGAFTNTYRANGTTVVATRSMSGIPYHSSRTDSFRIPRTGCYIALKLSIDSGNVVSERLETNNTAWLVGQATNPCSTAPKYTIKAETFKAVDESSYNLGSDEPFWNFSSVGTTGTARTTQTKVFGSVDTGETHGFGATEGCLWRDCGLGDYAPNGVGLSVQLWEKDQGDMTENRARAEEYFKYAGIIATVAGAPVWVNKAIPYVQQGVDWVLSNLEDDLMVTQTFAFSPADLAGKVPLKGQSTIYPRTFEGGGGKYTLNLRITRVS